MRLPFRLARRFVAGETIEEAIVVVRDLNARGLSVSLDLLGEYVHDARVAEAGRDAYIALVHTVADERERRGLDANVSIKLSMIGQKINEAFCLDNLQLLLTAARTHDVFVRLDMEGSDTTASTLRLFEEVYPQFPNHVGVVLQAALKRTEGDVHRMCELNARVRLCKGAYREPPEIAYRRTPEIRERFMRYARILLLESPRPGIATHDDRLIDAVRAFVAEESLDKHRFEFQMLFGIRPATQERLVREGYDVRIYTPFGTQWRPYFTRRLRERKENVWFVLRNLFRR